MNKKQIIGAVVAVLLFIAIGVSSVLTHTFSERYLAKTAAQVLTGGVELSLPYGDYVGIVSVEGTIQAQTAANSLFTEVTGYQHDTSLDYIDAMIMDASNRGLLLRIDSPGGAVYESEELYLKINEYKEQTGRPVWTYMEHYAASGGYYVAAPSDVIYANPNTTTGSIGVIISGYDMSGLYEKLGIKSISVTSGMNKDMSSPDAEQLAIYQAIVDESYTRFVEIVAEGRNMSADEVKKLADGRIYTALQAKANGLIDEVGLYMDVEQAILKELGPVTFYEPEYTGSVWSSILGRIESLIPRSEAEVLTDLTKEYGSGVPMYYAEQLQ